MAHNCHLTCIRVTSDPLTRIIHGQTDWDFRTSSPLTVGIFTFTPHKLYILIQLYHTHLWNLTNLLRQTWGVSAPWKSPPPTVMISDWCLSLYRVGIQIEPIWKIYLFHNLYAISIWNHTHHSKRYFVVWGNLPHFGCLPVPLKETFLQCFCWVPKPLSQFFNILCGQIFVQAVILTWQSFALSVAFILGKI